MLQTEGIVLASRPAGMPTLENFRFEMVDLPELQEGQVLVRTTYISVDPYMRGRMSDRKSYIAPFIVGEVITGGVVGTVIRSRSAHLQEGDTVTGDWGWQRHAVCGEKRVRRIEEKYASAALGVLGMPGLTAYFGLLDIGQPKEGETVVVSGAAGAVGMTVGQIAKIKGARVVGIAGSDEKLTYLRDELGFDAVVNYKSENLKEELKAACLAGVDVYFDNVGGTLSDLVMRLINKNARISICGQIASYNLEKADSGPRAQTLLLMKSAMMKGFIVSDYASRFKEGALQLSQWVSEGRIRYREHIVEGFEQTPQAFLALFSGENTGKLLVRIPE